MANKARAGEVQVDKQHDQNEGDDTKYLHHHANW